MVSEMASTRARDQCGVRRTRGRFAALVGVGLAFSCGASQPSNAFFVAAIPSVTFYVSVAPGAKDTNSGTDPKSPVRTLAKAVSLAKKSGGTIKVTTGRFEGPGVTLPARVLVEGGWDRDFARQTVFRARQLRNLEASDKLCDGRTCISSNTSDRVITISGDGAGLRQVVVLGPDRSKSPGSSSFGVIVDKVDSSLNGVVIKAGRGGPGADGRGGAKGTGHCSKGGNGGIAKLDSRGFIAIAICRAEKHDGQQGQTIKQHGRTANGGAGGTHGDSNCSGVPTALTGKAPDGGAGGVGDQGIEGPPGAAAESDEGGFRRVDGALEWVSTTRGKAGHSGSAGGGGGGGGAGGSWNVVYVPCGLLGYSVLGGPGQVGNRGGCGGGGGEGGATGGGAFSLVINGGVVTGKDVVLFGGEGGGGGIGGNGNVGAPGGTSDAIGGPGSKTRGCGKVLFWDMPETQGGTGGRGGHGGAGGGGGGGAGGNGGPAFTLVKLGKGVLQSTGIFRIHGGRGGQPGKGGLGASSQTRAPSGGAGAQEDEIVLELH